MISLLLKVLVSGAAIWLAAFLAPGMSVENFGAAIVAAIVIGLLDWVLNKFLGVDPSPLGKGVTGFLVAAVVLFVAGKLVNGLNVSILGALIGALVLGIVDMILPGGRTY
ncbi:putative membrane protein [Peptoniphilus sp. ING2-D1G]|nr:putative membrane protein [Peptoniphilus sp. ING2-D1G]